MQQTFATMALPLSAHRVRFGPPRR